MSAATTSTSNSQKLTRLTSSSSTRSLYHHHTSQYAATVQPSSIRGLATPWTYFLHLSLSSVILTDSSTESPVHVLMMSIQAVRGLPRLLLFPYPHSPFHPFLLPIPPSHFMSFPSIFPTFSFPRITARGSEGALQLPQRVQAKPGRQA